MMNVIQIIINFIAIFIFEILIAQVYSKLNKIPIKIQFKHLFLLFLASILILFLNYFDNFFISIFKTILSFLFPYLIYFKLKGSLKVIISVIIFANGIDIILFLFSSFLANIEFLKYFANPLTTILI